jgi:hypothetical protein
MSHQQFNYEQYDDCMTVMDSREARQWHCGFDVHLYNGVDFCFLGVSLIPMNRADGS